MAANMYSKVYCVPCNKSPVSAHVQYFFHINFHIFFLLKDCHSFHIHKRKKASLQANSSNLVYSTALKKQRALGWLIFKRWKKYEGKEYFQVSIHSKSARERICFQERMKVAAEPKVLYHSSWCRVLWGLNSLMETSVLCALSCKKKPRPKVISGSCLSS